MEMNPDRMREVARKHRARRAQWHLRNTEAQLRRTEDRAIYEQEQARRAKIAANRAMNEAAQIFADHHGILKDGMERMIRAVAEEYGPTIAAQAQKMLEHGRRGLNRGPTYFAISARVAPDAAFQTVDVSVEIPSIRITQRFMA